MSPVRDIHLTRMFDRARSEDVPKLHSLIERAYRGDSARRGWTHEADLLGGQRTDEAALEAMLADPAQRILVHRSDGGLDGCISLTAQDGGTVYIGLVTVDPDAQGSGLGKRLLAAAEQYAAEAFAAVRSEMTVIRQRPELIAWYKRRGYKETGELRPFPASDRRFGLPKRDDLEFIVLEKDIRSPPSRA